MKKLVYLAAPYSHPDLVVRKSRFVKANIAAGMLILRGYLVISPISHSHPIAVANDLKGNWETWKEFDERIFPICDLMVILTLAGWQQSEGVLAETRLALALCKPIKHMDPFTYQLK